MDFKKYNSIENSYRTKFLNKIVEEGKSGLEFVVQEKVHGANFSFWITKDEIKCAKRSGFIKPDENFFNYEKILDRYGGRLRELFDGMGATFGIEELVIFGELYGGSYPHPEVQQVNVSTVQKGVFYCPDVDFIAFDMKIDGQYEGVASVETNLGLAGIPFLQTLFRGSLEDCLNHSNEFQTTIPAIHGLPEIENNVCEGVVIRPMQTEYLWDHSRLILKNKNDKFKEKAEAKKGPKKLKQEDPLEQIVLDAIEQASPYINENRLRNVLSKIGTVTDKDFGKIMGLFTKDAVEDFIKDEEALFESLSKVQRKQLTKKIGQAAALLVRENFLNIIDGEF